MMKKLRKWFAMVLVGVVYAGAVRYFEKKRWRNEISRSGSERSQLEDEIADVTWGCERDEKVSKTKVRNSKEFDSVVELKRAVAWNSPVVPHECVPNDKLI